ncbi:MAG TPA: hypothetical protein VK539_40590 [Myxococcaceae bacterium]|nr:hypothetical protein [Myxococcaceae bacterium]
MGSEASRPRWAALGIAAALLATGCATLPAPPGTGEPRGPAEVLREEDVTGALAAPPHSGASSQEKRPRVRLRRRHAAPVVGTDVALVRAEELAPRQAADARPSAQEPPSCGGQAVPEGWPDFSSGWEEQLLAPFFRCGSPAEFLALQRQVDMARLVEALDDGAAVRLGALGPLEDAAAQVLRRKRFSFLVNAQRRYGAYAPVFALFLVDTAFDDEVRELLGLLAGDKQLAQTVGQMEAVREALARRGFQLSDYPERGEQLSDVARGLGRAVEDVGATLPGADGARGTRVYGARAHLPPPYQQAFDQTERALTRGHFSPGHVALGTFDALTFGVPLGFYALAAGTGQGVHTLTQGQYEQAARELAPAALMVGLYVGGKGGRSRARAQAGVGAEGMRPPTPELRMQVLKQGVERLRARLGESDFAQLGRWLQGRREVGVLVATHGEPFALALVEARGDLVRAHAVFSHARPEPRGPVQPMAGGGKSPDRAATRGEETTGATPKKPGTGIALSGEAISGQRVLRVLEQVRERAGASTFRRAANYHAHFSEARVLEILRNPDAIYESSGRAGKLIYRQGGDIVVVEGPGSGQGQVITGYGPSGIRAESGARALGGAPTDPGTPITHEMITGGTIPVSPKSPKLPAAIQIWPPSDGSP